MTNKFKLPFKLIEQTDPFNINSNILPKNGEYIIRVFLVKMLTTRKGILALIKGLLGMDIQERTYRVVLYLNESTIAETDVNPDAWNSIRGQTIKRLINYAETHYNNTFKVTGDLKNLTQGYKNKCEYLKEKK